MVSSLRSSTPLNPRFGEREVSGTCLSAANFAVLVKFLDTVSTKCKTLQKLMSDKEFLMVPFQHEHRHERRPTMSRERQTL